MPSPKKIAIPAIFGFVLSFLISLIATGNFGWALLRGLIFGVLFGVLFFVIDFVFTKFLAEEGSPVSSFDSGKRFQEKSGSRIDITVSDEDLTDDGQNLTFPVKQNKVNIPAKEEPSASPSIQNLRTPFVEAEQAAGLEELRDGSPASDNSTRTGLVKPAADVPPVQSNVAANPASQQNAENVFTPITLGTPVDVSLNSSATKVVTGSHVKPSQEASKKMSNEELEIDALPEISDFVPEIGRKSSASEVVEDSDFAKYGSPTGSESLIDGSKAAGHDAATIAKAIQTFMKSDE